MSESLKDLRMLRTWIEGLGDSIWLDMLAILNRTIVQLEKAQEGSGKVKRYRFEPQYDSYNVYKGCEAIEDERGRWCLYEDIEEMLRGNEYERE